jgi:hypothetical protein
LKEDVDANNDENLVYEDVADLQKDDMAKNAKNQET